MIHNFTQISFKEHLTLLPLPMSVLQQPTLPLEESVQQQSVLPLDIFVLQQPLLPGYVCICKHLKEPRNRFPAWWNRFLDASTTTLFVVPARQAT